MDKSETSVMLKIRVFQRHQRELLRTCKRAPEFGPERLVPGRSTKRVTGVFGGVVRGDDRRLRRSRKHPEDVELLEKGGGFQVAAAAHALISAASPESSNRQSSRRSDTPRDIGKILDTTEIRKWKSSG